MSMYMFYDINWWHTLLCELLHSTPKFAMVLVLASSLWHNCYLLASHACHTVDICTNYEYKVYIDFTSRHIALEDRESLNGAFILYYISHLEKAEQTRFIITHYNDVTMGAMASQITSLTIVYSAVYSGEDQRKHQSSA